MNSRHISAALVLTGLMWSSAALLHGRSTDPRAYVAFSTTERSRAHRYRVDVRLRPLLFWIRKPDIGDGRLTWREGPDGATGYELLVGSDPARTPRHINRWGYLREESGTNGATVLGVMSQSDEQSVRDADKSTNGTDGLHAFKALRQVVAGSQTRVTVSAVRMRNDPTYADVDALLAAVPAAPSETRTVAAPQVTSPGFLAAVASLMEGGRATADQAPNTHRFVRTYVYNGQLYQLQLRSAERLDRYAREGRSFGRAIRGQFCVLNGTTHEETPFTVVYGIEGDLTDVPLLISWRPRWWFEVECALRHE
jgi:hypothetical protein